jgi:hypothetical protein
MNKILFIFLFIIIQALFVGCSDKENIRAQPLEKKPSQRVSDNYIKKKF